MGDERDLEQLQHDITTAQEALLQIVATDPARWWDARTLREQAQNGSAGDVMMFALTDLVNRRQLEINSELQVRAAPH